MKFDGPNLQALPAPDQGASARLRAAELQYIKPAIWRRIIVPGSIRLGKLHVMLLLAMGWEGWHMHEFIFGEINYGEPDDFRFPSDPPMINEARVTLAKVLGGFLIDQLQATDLMFVERRLVICNGLD